MVMAVVRNGVTVCIHSGIYIQNIHTYTHAHMCAHTCADLLTDWERYKKKEGPRDGP